MNLTIDRWGGTHANTRTGRREAVLEITSARVQTLEAAIRSASAESIRRRRPLVYHVMGTHNLSGPLRERTEDGSKLSHKAKGQHGRGMFITVDGERVARHIIKRS